MASANLQFKIGSTFSDEGFKQAQKAVGNVKQSVQPALTATNSLASAFSELSTSSNKAAAAIGSLLGAFAQGGVKAAAFVLAQTAINVAVNKFYEEATKAAEASKKLSDALTSEAHGAFTDTMATRISSIKNEISGIRQHFDTLTSQANAFRDAMNGLQSSRAEGGVIAIQIEKFNAMLEADSEEMKKDIEATYNLRIAKEQAKKTEEDAAAKVKSAADAREQCENRMKVINEQIETIEARRSQLEEELNTLQENDLITRRDKTKKLAELDATGQQLEKDLQSEQAKLKTLLVKEQTALQDSANANDKMTIAVKEAELKIKDLQFEKAEELAKANEEYMKELEKVSKENFEKLNKELEKNKQALKDANAKVRTAVDNMNAAVKAYNENFVVNEIARAIQGAMNPVVAGLGLANQNMLKNAGQIAQGAAKVAGQAAIDKGLVKTVAELKKVQDGAFKDAMKKMSDKETNQMGLEAQRAARLEKMGKAISETDKKWLENYRAVKEGNEKQLKAVEDAKKAVADAKKRQDQLQKDVNTIAQALANPQNLAGDIATVKDAVDSSATSIIQAIENKQVNVTVEDNGGSDSINDSRSDIDVSGIEDKLATIATAIENIELTVENNGGDTSSDSSDGDTGSDVDLSGIESGISSLTEAVNVIKDKIDHEGIKTEISNVKDNLSNCLQMK